MEKYPLLRKGFTIGIILLFVVTGIIPSTAQNMEKPFPPISRGKWLYVGGNGPGNYTKIQDAIDNTTIGDTVFVFNDSSPYYESILINKSITLMGENKDTTIIDGTGSTSEKMIEVTASGVTIIELCIQHCPHNLSWTLFIDHCNMCIITHNMFQHNSQSAVYLSYAKYAHISNNTFINNSIGLFLNQGGNHTIQDNKFINNSVGICFYLSNWNTIRSNTISYSDFFGIICEISHYNLFSENLIDGNDYGFASEVSYKNTYYHNTISNNDLGMYLIISQQNTIKENNFINNLDQAQIMYVNFIGLGISIYYKLHFSRSSGFLSLIGRNRWEANYWSDWKSSSPKPIDRFIYLLGLQLVLSRITGKLNPFYIFQYDWHPAQEPYDIGV